MRKTALKKKFGSRKKMFKALRDNGKLHYFTDSKGNEIALNLFKRFLIKGNYSFPEYQKEFVRFKSEVMNTIRENIQRSAEEE